MDTHISIHDKEKYNIEIDFDNLAFNLSIFQFNRKKNSQLEAATTQRDVHKN